MSDTFLPGNGFDTYETQDKALIALDGGAACEAAARILQQQGFGVTGAALRLTDENGEAVAAARQSAKRLGVECVTLDARALRSGSDSDMSAVCAALLTAADKLGAQYIALGVFARTELDSSGASRIAPCADAASDESALLAELSQETLARLLLPLGEFSRADAEELLAAITTK